MQKCGPAWGLGDGAARYFDAPADRPLPERRAGVRLAVGINAAAVLLLGLLPGVLIDLCARLLTR